MCKKFEDFEAESKQYNQIIHNYLENGQVFVDPNFHPHQHIQEKIITFDESDTEWKRIDEVYQAPLFKKELIGPNYVQHGDLSDYFFLTAISYLSTQPEKVPFLFDHRVELYMNKEEDTINLKCGAVVIYLHAFGRRVPVLIDTLIPFSKTTQKAIFSRPINDSKSPWFCLVEKAYAKLNGSFSKIMTGTFSEAIYSLYGFYFTNKSEVKSSLMSPFDRIQKYLSQRAIIGAEIRIESLDGLIEKDIDQKGLVTNQSYLILSAKKVADINLICLRNPLVENVWNGDWSDGSELWNPELRRTVEYENSEDGTFWMSDSDFLNYFTDISVSKPIPNKWFLRQFSYQLLPSYNDGFDIESEEASLSERPNFAFQIIENFEKGENSRLHILVERRQDDDVDRLNDEKTPFCVFVVSNSGKKIVASELPFCRKCQMTSSSNLISFPYTVNSNEEILTIVLYRLNKCELIEDCYVKVFCERDFKLYNIDEPEKAISEDKITFSSKLLSELDKISIFDQDNANVEEEEEVLDIYINESNKEDEIKQNDEFNQLQSENYFNEVLKNQNDQIKQSDEFNQLQSENYFNEVLRNKNDQIKQSDEFNQLQSENYFNEVKIDQNSELKNQNTFNENINKSMFRNELNEKEDTSNDTFNNELDKRTNNVSFNITNNNEINRNVTDNKNDDQNSKIPDKEQITNVKSIILNEDLILNRINSNEQIQDKPNIDIHSNDEKMKIINPRKKLEKKVSSSTNLNFNVQSNDPKSSQINSIQQHFNPNLGETPEINAVPFHKTLEASNTSNQSNSEKTSQINSIQQYFRPSIDNQSDDQKNTEINSMQLLKESNKETPNNIESISSNQPNNENDSQINSMQQYYRPNSSIQLNDQRNTETNPIQLSKNIDKESSNINDQNSSIQSQNERTSQINSMQTHQKSEKKASNNTEQNSHIQINDKKTTQTNLNQPHQKSGKEASNQLNANIQSDEVNQNEQKQSSPHRHSRRSINHKSSQNRKISKDMIQSPSKSFQQRKLAHQKMNEEFLSQMTRKPSPNSKQQQSVIRTQKSDSTLNDDVRLKKRKSSPMRSPGEMKPEKRQDLNQTGQHSPILSSKKLKQPASPKTTFSNKDMHKMFSSITDNVFMSRFNDNK